MLIDMSKFNSVDSDESLQRALHSLFNLVYRPEQFDIKINRIQVGLELCSSICSVFD